MNAITCTEFTQLDPEVISDFYECLHENIENIELCINKLESSEDPDLVHDLFGAIHSLKGNFRMVLLTPFVIVTHELEEIISEMRDGMRHFHHLYGSIFITIITIVEMLINQLTEYGECSQEMVDVLTEQVVKIRNAEHSPSVDDLVVAEEVLTELINLQDMPATVARHNVQKDESASRQATPEKDLSRQTDDMKFFKMFASQLDGLSIYRQGRTEEVLKLCLAVNEGLDSKVCLEQLTAAVYIHDIGMAFVPNLILNKQEVITLEEIELIRKHINIGTQLLTRINGWQEAATMVVQHHERFDGCGYPQGLKGDKIHSGAILLALADTYCSITNKRSDRSYKKTLFSAVTLINAESGKQFSPRFVEMFNDIIRKLYIMKS